MLAIVRVGHGYDLHRCELGRKLILVGLEVPAPKGLAGHSDADVVLHAVIDALLGAAGLGDIGEQFPDTDPQYEGIDSAILLERTLENVHALGYAPANVDATIIAEAPKLQKHKPAMRRNLAQMLGLPIEAVSIKAKTNEGLGDIGAGRAVACHAIVGLAQRNEEACSYSATCNKRSSS